MTLEALKSRNGIWTAALLALIGLAGAAVGALPFRDVPASTVELQDDSALSARTDPGLTDLFVKLAHWPLGLRTSTVSDLDGSNQFRTPLKPFYLVHTATRPGHGKDRFECLSQPGASGA